MEMLRVSGNSKVNCRAVRLAPQPSKVAVSLSKGRRASKASTPCFRSISTVTQATSADIPARSSEVGKRRVVVFVEPSPFTHISGMRNRFIALIDSLRQEGDDVVVCTPCIDPPKEYNGAKVINMWGMRLPFYDSKTLRVTTGISFAVFYELWKNRPDIIHTCSPGILALVAGFYGRLLSIPVLVSYHTHIPEYIPRYDFLWDGLVKPCWEFIKIQCNNANMTLVTSTVMQKELADNGIKQLDVWQRGVDTMRFNPRFKSEAMRVELCDGRDGPLLIHVGRLGSEKNIRAIRYYLEKIPDANLAVVGDGPDRADLEEYFKGTRTKFMGMMSGDALSEVYASGDVFVMPSESETLGFVVLEAMASGTPVVSVAAGGLTDIITKPGVTGLLYPPSEYDLAVEQIKSLIDNPELRQKIAAAGKEEVDKWSFHASNVKLREQQYTRAIRRANLAKRFVKLIKAINFNNWLRRWRYTMGVAAMVLVCAIVHNVAFPGSAAAAWAQARSCLKALLPL